MTLQLVFGWYLDGPTFPETTDGSRATLGKLVGGPAVLINQLALRYGLLRPLIPQAVRIANYLSALKQIDDGKQLFSRSFQIDAWSTASYMLVLRDQLVSAGWTAEIQHDAGPKINAIGMAERVAENIGGVADITRDVMIRVQNSRKRCDISSIGLVTQRERLPNSWQNLFNNIAMNGTTIDQREYSPTAPEHSDLGKIQRMFSGSKTCQLSDDGTVIVLEADDELQASEAVAAYLAADPGANENLVIVRGANTALLDEACSIQGLPRIGGTLKSRWRSILQLLSLAISSRWEPADPLTMLEFLSLPLSPVPRRVSYRFARALRLLPGFGTSHWQQAWADAIQDSLARGDDENDIGRNRKTQTFERELNYWLQPTRFDPCVGIPAHELVAVSRRIQKWALQGTHGNDNNSKLLMDLYVLCKCFEDSVKGTGLTVVTKAQIDRILDAVFKDGIAAPGSSAEASVWSHVDVPGQVWGETSTVVWWGCVGNRAERFYFPWSIREISTLQSLGVFLEHPVAETLRQDESWRACLFSVKNEFLMVCPRGSAADTTREHPFKTELFARLASSGCSTSRSIIRQAHEIYERPRIRLGTRELIRELSARIAIPSATRIWNVTPGAVLPRLEESASSVELLLGCPMAWTLRYHAQMHPGAMLSVSHGSELTGALIHFCIHKLYTESKDWTPVLAADRVTEIFDEQIRKIALPLLLPGRIVERTQIRTALGEAIFDFQNLIQGRGLSVWETEVRRQSKLLDGNLIGQLDLVLRDKASNEYVVDFKWSKTAKYKTDEIKQGRHLQLACYASLQRGSGESTVGAGFYMVKQKQLLSTASQLFPSNQIASPVSLEALWQSAIIDCEDEFSELLNGRVCAAGIDSTTSGSDDQPNELIPPPCKFCDYGSICGKNDYGS